MPFVIIHHFPGGTQAQYEATIAALHPSGGRLPPGQLIHTAGASPGGWTVIAVYESQQGYEHFRDATLLPRLQQGIPGGFQTPPQETTFASHTFLK
ncbi:MAG TPA: hypothetical protein VMT50_01630 [Steroidobacteraceae bacterium]|nr:hypothetical protein [Steroidobacteraceae bacterium]